MTADAVVDYSLKCLSKNKPICIPGFWNKVLYMLVRTMPRKILYLFLNKSKI
ncbi:MAG: hypothetical protein AB1756_10330 [Acidobacteriota bacterium]